MPVANVVDGKVVTGKTPSTSNSGYFGGQFPFIKTPDMHGNIFVLQTEETLTEIRRDILWQQCLLP